MNFNNYSGLSLILNCLNLLRIYHYLILAATCPKKDVENIQNSYLDNLALTFFSFNRSRIICKYHACFSLLLQYTKISTINTVTKEARKDLMTPFIKLIKVVSALVNKMTSPRTHNAHNKSKVYLWSIFKIDFQCMLLQY